MKTVQSFTRRWFVAGIVVLMGILMFAGCAKNNNPVTGTGHPSATDDAAESVAGALAYEGGGALDQIADIADIAGAVGFNAETDAIVTKHGGPSLASVSKSYDSTSGWWTMTVSRSRSDGFVNAGFQRTYQYQFLNEANVFQQYWLTAGDTAHSMHFKIVSGTGMFTSPRVHHHLVSLDGQWIVTGVNAQTITINTEHAGAYTRIGSDTMRTPEGIRTLNHTLSLTFENVTGPRGDRLHLANKTGGTITGTYHAEITFTRGSMYMERIIDKSISITLGGGTAVMDIGGRRFRCDMLTGAMRR